MSGSLCSSTLGWPVGWRGVAAAISLVPTRAVVAGLSLSAFVLVAGVLATSPAAAELSSVPIRTVAADGAVGSIVPAGGVVYLGGDFVGVGPATGPGVAVSRTSGLLLPRAPVVAASPCCARVDAVVADGSGGWYIGGTFTSVGGLARHDVAHILADGRVDPRFGPDADGGVTTLAISGRTLYVAGRFLHIGGARRPHLAALSASSGRASGWNPRLARESAASSATVAAGSSRWR